MQRGRGRREPRKLISDYYRIIVNRTRLSRKFKSQQNVYNVSIKELPEKNPTFVRRLFRDILKNVKQKMGAAPNDYLRVNIDHPSLDSPVWIEFTQTKNLTEEKILNKIEAVQQSKKEFSITDGGMEIDFFHVKYPEGSGGNRKKSTCTWIRKISRSPKETLYKLKILRILCVYLVPVFMLRNLTCRTRSGTRNG
jgi:hypothetical protein